jgi:hypothetical protein
MDRSLAAMKNCPRDFEFIVHCDGASTERLQAQRSVIAAGQAAQLAGQVGSEVSQGRSFLASKAGSN